MRSYLPEFSVVIPTRGRLNSLRNCLSGLTRMDYPHDRYEVIVVNDGGPLLKKEDVAPWGRYIDLSIHNQAHRGPAAARNAGVSRSKGEYVAFLDDDCIPSADWLKGLVRRAVTEERCAAGGRTVNALPQNLFSVASQMMVDYLYHMMNREAERARFLATNNLIVPRDRFLTVGGFDPGFRRPAGEDRDFCRRWVQRGYPMRYVPEAVVFHAHDLRFWDYLRQHAAYGRGAVRFHRAGSGGLLGGVEPLRYYWDLVLFPLRQQGVRKKYTLTLLMALSQAATAAGWIRGVGWGPLTDPHQP